MFKGFGSKKSSEKIDFQNDAAEWLFFNEYFDGIIIVVDLNMRVTFANRVIESFEPGEMMGTKATGWVYAEDREIFSKSIEEVFGYGRLVNLEIRGKGPNNTIAWYSVRIGPVKEGDKIMGAMIISSDITHLKKTIQRMEDNKDAMINLLEDIEKSRIASENAKIKDEAILLNIGEGLAVINQDGVLELVNQRLAEMLLSGPADFLGRQWKEALVFKYEDNRDVEIGKVPIQEAFDFKTRVTTTPMITTSMRYFLSRVDNKRIPVQVTASPIITDGRVSQVIAVIRDISKEIELEKTKTEFVSIASHQLRTPLSTVNWYTEMLLSGEVGEANVKQQDYLNEIYRGNQRMIEHCKCSSKCVQARGWGFYS